MTNNLIRRLLSMLSIIFTILLITHPLTVVKSNVAVVILLIMLVDYTIINLCGDDDGN